GATPRGGVLIVPGVPAHPDGELTVTAPFDAPGLVLLQDAAGDGRDIEEVEAVGDPGLEGMLQPEGAVAGADPSSREGPGVVHPGVGEVAAETGSGGVAQAEVWGEQLPPVLPARLDAGVADQLGRVQADVVVLDAARRPVGLRRESPAEGVVVRVVDVHPPGAAIAHAEIGAVGDEGDGQTLDAVPLGLRVRIREVGRLVLGRLLAVSLDVLVRPGRRIQQSDLADGRMLRKAGNGLGTPGQGEQQRQGQHAGDNAGARTLWEMRVQAGPRYPPVGCLSSDWSDEPRPAERRPTTACAP